MMIPLETPKHPTLHVTHPTPPLFNQTPLPAYPHLAVLALPTTPSAETNPRPPTLFPSPKSPNLPLKMATSSSLTLLSQL
jgi:hypothetical protein